MAESLVCPGCGEAVQPEWSFCPACERPLAEARCPGCGDAVKAHWKRCPACGRRLACSACGRRLPPDATDCPHCLTASTPGAGEGPCIEPVTGMAFVFVKGGTFSMGDLFEVGWDNETPPREVRIEDFFLAKTPVTQGQWSKIMPENPSHFRLGEDYPVEQVSWADVQEFIRRLRERSPGLGEFRLPTEAEWEYAARSGGKRELYAGGDEIDRVAWYAENSGGTTQPVGRKAPNGLGLYDMSGNVWEWCADLYIPGAVAVAPQARSARRGVTERVIRGGSWSLDDWSARCSRRFGFPEDYYGAGLGFRLAFSASRRRP